MQIHKKISFHKQIDLNQLSEDFVIKKIKVCEFDSSRNTVIRADIDYVIVKFEDKLLLCPQSDYEEFVLYADCIVSDNHCHRDYLGQKDNIVSFKVSVGHIDPGKFTIYNCPNPCCGSFKDCLNQSAEYCRKRLLKSYM